MAEEEELESTSEEEVLEEEDEELEASPDDDTVSEVEDEVEEEAPPWKRVRDDIYRRQSRSEQMVQNAISELRGMMEGVRTQAETPRTASHKTSNGVLDPMQAKIRMTQDPVGFFRGLIKEELQGLDDKVAAKVESKSTIKHAQAELNTKYPELKNQMHPFYEEVDRIYSDLTENQGFPAGPHTGLIAARIANAERPELRNSNLKKRSREATRTSMAEAARVDRGAPRPKTQKTSDLPALTEQDHKLASVWGVDLRDKKEAEAIRKEKARLDKLRISPRESEED